MIASLVVNAFRMDVRRSRISFRRGVVRAVVVSTVGLAGGWKSEATS